MRNIKQIFINNRYLLNEPEVEELIEYCRELEDEIVELKQNDSSLNETILKEMICEIKNGCDEILDSKDIDYNQAIQNLRNYILTNIEQNNLRL